MEPQYITNNKGKKISVVLSIREYNKLIEAWEELADIKAYDEAKSKKSETVDAHIPLEEIESYHKREKNT